jgi:hypothetical protein
MLILNEGVGKTSLIKSIVQHCEDIVHIDASLPTSSPVKKDSKKLRTSSRAYNKTKKIAETFASTRAYPPWWSDLEESSVLRRRKSGDGTVLERNLCFVDTPGYDSGTSLLEGMDLIIQYIEGQIKKTLNITSLDDAELLGLVGGSGGCQVDVVLYLLAHRKALRLDVLVANFYNSS